MRFKLSILICDFKKADKMEVLHSKESLGNDCCHICRQLSSKKNILSDSRVTTTKKKCKSCFRASFQRSQDTLKEYLTPYCLTFDILKAVIWSRRFNVERWNNFFFENLKPSLMANDFFYRWTCLKKSWTHNEEYLKLQNL